MDFDHGVLDWWVKNLLFLLLFVKYVARSNGNSYTQTHTHIMFTHVHHIKPVDK